MSHPSFQAALRKEPVAIPPIWFMRQAGRYHDHYQELKKRHSFMELCKDAELAAETAMGPIRDFDFDVAILFSDLLFPLEAMGMGLTYNPGPELAWTLEEGNIGQLKDVDKVIGFMKFQADAVRETRKVLPEVKSLIGFVGGPWTLFTYAVEGAHKGNLIRSKTSPNLWRKFAEKITYFLEHNIQMQISAGAEVVMIFDTAAGELSSSEFHREVVPYLSKLSQKFPQRLGYYSKGTVEEHLNHASFTDGAWAGLGVDHRWNLPKVLKSGKFPGFLQGNFDQAMLFGDTALFKARLEEYLQSFRVLSEKERAGWVCGLGHGVLPQTPQERVRYFVRRVREVFGG